MSAPAGSTAHCTLEVRNELMSLTLRMVGEYPEYQAGSVMRRVARAVRRALMVGTPAEQIPARAEHAARRALTDPEGSPACLCGSGHPPSGADQRDPPPGDVRLPLNPGPTDGLRLRWALVPAEETHAVSSTFPQRRTTGAHRRN